MTSARRLLMIMVSALYALATSNAAHAVVATDLAQVPLFLVQSAEPLVMLNMSNDHQLFYKAYDDWSDLDPDRTDVYGDADPDGVETTYKHEIDYYGYFDSYKCYTHDGGRFVPALVVKADPPDPDTDKYCPAGNNYWSGNFLNWASMARIDTVRKILFGGFRSTDDDSATNDGLTVLERAYLPGDAHSFAKYYKEAPASGEMAKLTPWTDSEITICNTTYAADGESETRTNPPLLRVASGNFALWAANERHQCHWKGNGELEGSRNYQYPGWPTAISLNNGNNPLITGLDAWPNNPTWATDRLGNGDYIARVEVCNDGSDANSKSLIGTEKCKVYPDSNSKPIGVLQEHGDGGEFFVGLMTGSFANNKSGGTLRKNVGPLTDEINVTSDGTFKSPLASGNIIDTLSKLRVSGYDHNPGYYNSADNCSWGINSFNNGSCTNWGNPQSEIYLETLRYFVGASPDSAFEANDNAYLPGLVTASTWNDPLGTANYCAPVNVIQFNASVSSYDGEMAGASDLDGTPNVSTWTGDVGGHEGINGNHYFVGAGTSVTNGLCTAKTLASLSDAAGLCPEAPRLGGDFDIAGLAFYARTTSIRDDILLDVGTADERVADINVKTFGVTLAPAVPKIEVIRAGETDPEDVVAVILPACKNQSIDGNCAIVDFKVVQKQTETSPGSGQYKGRYYVNWEDSEQGGDYDQDMAGIIEYVVTDNAITVTTSTFGQSTPYAMGFGYIIAGTGILTDGYHVHSGINGFNEVAPCSNVAGGCVNLAPATSVTYTLPAIATTAGLLPDPLLLAAKYGGFVEDELPVSKGGTCPDGLAEYTSGPLVGSDVIGDSCDPADDSDPNFGKCFCPGDGIPNQDWEWKDTVTGLPETYFYATNPAELEGSLSDVFLDASKDTASASSTAANSQRVSTETTIFQARFDSTDWSGELLAFPVIPSTGALSTTASWDAGAKLEGVAEGARTILTNNGGTGVDFVWASLSNEQQEFLDRDPVTQAFDYLGDERLLYLRGDRTGEVQDGGEFRDRSRKLGDLVNSSPAYVGGLPGFAYPNWLERYENTSSPTTLTNSSAESYSEFITRMKNMNSMNGRDAMLYVGGNDGMLHGFTATPDASLGGVEKVAFVPNAVYTTLNQLTSPAYSHRYYVDGTPTFGDVMFADHYWHTILVGGLNAGGRGIYALDVTDPGLGSLSPNNVFLWEIETTTGGGNFDDLGYTYSRPSIVKNHGGGNAFTYEANEGKWVVVFGNGYASAAGKAVLYIADAETGAYIDSVEVDAGPDNGLTTASPIDLDGDYKVDVIYAGDLKGNVWKFIPDGSVNGWKADFGGSPLFTAPADPSGVMTDTQAITMRPEIGRHPDGLPGVMVYFGTGSYFRVGDNVGDASTESVYAIWDVWNRCFDGDTGARRSVCSSDFSKKGASVSDPPVPPPVTPAIDRDTLLGQCVTAADGTTCKAKQVTAGAGDVSSGTVGVFDVRVMSDNDITVWDWRAAEGVMGWYIDLPDYGEKQVTRHTLRAGRLIFVTIIPSDHACEDGGESWLMEVSARTGGRLSETVFDLNGDGYFTYDDNLGGTGTAGDYGAVEGVPVSGKKSKEGIIQPPSIVTSADGRKEFKYASGSKGGVEVTSESRPIAVGRKSWMRIR